METAEVTTAEAAAILGVSERRVRQMADALGGRVNDETHRLMFPLHAVEAEAAARQVERAADPAAVLAEILATVREIRDRLDAQEGRHERGDRP